MDKATQSKQELIYEYLVSNQGMFYRLAYSYVKNEQEALDVIQDAVEKAIKSIAQLKHETYMKTWFYRILVNESLQHLRKSRKIVLTNQEELKETVENFTKGVDIAEKMDIYHAVETLDEPFRTVIVLKYFEDMKNEEIAQITNTNLNTVKTRVRNALGKLNTMLNMEGKNE